MAANEVFARGRGAIITGGASGIGLATAKRLAATGMRVCIADLDTAALDAAAKELAGIASGGLADVFAVRTDVSSVAEIDRLAEATFARFDDSRVPDEQCGGV